MSAMEQPIQPLAAPRTLGASPGLAVCAIVFALVVAAAIAGAFRKDVTRGFDEVAHASYVAQIQASGAIWPELTSLRMVEPATFRFAGEANYLNHPPPYYVFLARLGPALEARPQALLAHRLVNVALMAIGLAALLGLALAARMPREELYAFCIPFACIPVLAPLAGAINNDNAAFAGGAVAMLGAWLLAEDTRARWLMLTLAGLIAASWAKLTGLMLAGGLICGVLAWLAWRGRLRRAWLAPIALAGLLAAAPYFVLVAQYGSPAPNIPGQIALLESGAHAAGWSAAERLSFFAYAQHFAAAFLIDWVPTLAQRNALHYAMLVLPAAAIACAVAGFAMSLRRMARREESALDVIVVSGCVAIAATLAVNLVFSYGRHVATGWMMDAYPRYYLPIAAIVPLAGLVLASALPARMRVRLLVFLIAGPIAFRLFGAPWQ